MPESVGFIRSAGASSSGGASSSSGASSSAGASSSRRGSINLESQESVGSLGVGNMQVGRSNTDITTSSTEIHQAAGLNGTQPYDSDDELLSEVAASAPESPSAEDEVVHVDDEGGE